LMWGVALIPVAWVQRCAVVIYLIAVALLLGVEFFGETSKGATRWLNLGVVRIQPSEGLKLAVPIMLAWYVQQRKNTQINLLDLLVSLVLLIIPFFLVVRQPDLGTALLVFIVGLSVIYFAGLPVRGFAPLVVLLLIGVVLMLHYEDTLCDPDFDWHILHSY